MHKCLQHLSVSSYYLADFVGDRRSGINQAVVDEVQSVFRGKTLQQLELLEKTIRNKLHGGEGIDVGMATSAACSRWLSVAGVNVHSICDLPKNMAEKKT